MKPMRWTREAGPVARFVKLETEPLDFLSYHAAMGCVCCFCCGHVVNARALSIMSVAFAPRAPLTPSRQTPIGVPPPKA